MRNRSERSELQSQLVHRRAKQVYGEPGRLNLNQHTLQTSKTTQYVAAETPRLEQLGISLNQRNRIGATMILDVKENPFHKIIVARQRSDAWHSIRVDQKYPYLLNLSWENSLVGCRLRSIP
jgi:hypothetical protein